MRRLWRCFGKRKMSVCIFVGICKAFLPVANPCSDCRGEKSGEKSDKGERVHDFNDYFFLFGV